MASTDRFKSSFEHDCEGIKKRHLGTKNRLRFSHSPEQAAELIVLRAQSELRLRGKQLMQQRQAIAKQMAAAAMTASADADQARALIEDMLTDARLEALKTIEQKLPQQDDTKALEWKTANPMTLLLEEALAHVDKLKAQPAHTRATNAVAAQERFKDVMPAVIIDFQRQAAKHSKQHQEASSAIGTLQDKGHSSDIDAVMKAVERMPPPQQPHRPPAVLKQLAQKVAAALAKPLATTDDPLQTRIDALEDAGLTDDDKRAATATIAKAAIELVLPGHHPDREADLEGLAKPLEQTTLAKTLEEHGADKTAIYHAQNFDSANHELIAAHKEILQLLRDNPDITSGTSTSHDAATIAKLHRAVERYQQAQEKQAAAAKDLMTYGGFSNANSLNPVAFAVFSAEANGAVHLALKAGLQSDPKRHEAFTQALRKRQSFNKIKSSGFTIKKNDKGELPNGFIMAFDRARTWKKGRPVGVYKQLNDVYAHEERAQLFMRYMASKEENKLELGEITRAGVNITLDTDTRHWQLGIDTDSLKSARKEYAQWREQFKQAWKEQTKELNKERAANGEPIDDRPSLHEKDIEIAYYNAKGCLAPPDDDRIESILQKHQHNFYKFGIDHLKELKKESDAALKAKRGEAKTAPGGTTSGVTVDGPESRSDPSRERAVSPGARSLEIASASGSSERSAATVEAEAKTGLPAAAI